MLFSNSLFFLKERSVIPLNVSLVSLIERLGSLIAIAVPIPLQNLPLRIFMNKLYALDRKPGFFFSFVFITLLFYVKFYWMMLLTIFFYASGDLIRKPTLRVALGRSNISVLKKLNPIRARIARTLGRPVTPKYLLHKVHNL